MYLKLGTKMKTSTMRKTQTMNTNAPSNLYPDTGYAGTIDRIIDMDGEKILLDIKTSNAIYPSYWLQLAAYRSLLMNKAGIRVNKVAILWLNAKTRTEGKKGDVQGIGWQLITKDDTDKELQLFNATLNLWAAENTTSKPKSLTYQISHKWNAQ